MCPFAAWCSSALPFRSVKLGLRGHFSNVSSATESWSPQADTIRWPSWNSGGQNSEHTSWTLTCWAVNASSFGISQDPSFDRNLCGTPIWVLRDCFISFVVFPCFSIIQDLKRQACHLTLLSTQSTSLCWVLETEGSTMKHLGQEILCNSSGHLRQKVFHQIRWKTNQFHPDPGTLFHT